MIIHVLALLLQSGFLFSAIHPWRWNEGRGEFIPALSAELDNRTGQDFSTVRLRVRVRCREGGFREYSVQVRDVLLGRQKVEATAYDSIGAVPWCDGQAEAEPLEMVPYRPEERPGFIVFGFSWKAPGQPATTDLAGILDWRQTEERQAVEVRTWSRHGARFELDGVADTAFYVIRVPPGRLGLGGFVLTPGDTRGPLSRFLRLYDVPAGTAAYLGIFRLEQEGPGRTAVTLEPAPELMPRLADRLPRPLMRASSNAPGSTLVLP